MKFITDELFWINQPTNYSISSTDIEIQTPPNTDFWQRTYYGFQNDNAPAILKKVDNQYFSFTVKTEFDSKRRFDQCGVIIYLDSENWFKASIEYENNDFQRLGSVVTNNGFSDWATTDIPSNDRYMYYRLSRRESDFCIENSYDGINFKQMRIFHMIKGCQEINIGLYACSPEKSSFKAKFSEIMFTECKWGVHI